MLLPYTGTVILTDAHEVVQERGTDIFDLLEQEEVREDPFFENPG